MQKKKYTYEEFLEIIKTLRSENGCPWDREQTHMTLRPCLSEEAAEVNGAIRILEQTGNYENLREELGDVLLQVVMHASIAQEEGFFTMEDVVSEVAEKMVRRHPHVFGAVKVADSDQVLENWEEIKRKEKQGKEQQASPLREIPIELPALTRAVKVLKKADKLYQARPDYAESVNNLQRAAEALADCEPVSYDEQIGLLTGDILLALGAISGICKLSPEQILTDRLDDLIDKWENDAVKSANMRKILDKP